MRRIIHSLKKLSLSGIFEVCLHVFTTTKQINITIVFTTTACSVEDETRNGDRNENRNPNRNHETIALGLFHLKIWKEPSYGSFLIAIMISICNPITISSLVFHGTGCIVWPLLKTTVCLSLSTFLISLRLVPRTKDAESQRRVSLLY